MHTFHKLIIMRLCNSVLDRLQNKVECIVTCREVNLYYNHHSKYNSMQITGQGAVVVICQLDLQLPVQSVPITTKVVSSNPVQGEVYSIQHYVIKFVSDLYRSVVFSGYSTNKTVVESGVKHHKPKPNQLFKLCYWRQNIFQC